MKNENLKKYALITGGTSGIGKELARLFAQDGYHLLLVARGEAGLNTTKQELESQYGVEVITIAKDLSDVNAAFELYDEVSRQHIFVDVLVNNAAQGQYGLFIKSDVRRLLEIIQLNAATLTALTYLFLKDMVAQNRGKILQLGSIASETPGPWQAVYHATKAFVRSLSDSIRYEIKDTDITVTVLEPGATDTDFFRKADMQDSKILDSGLSDPAKVAEDGYKALHSGKDTIISGVKNKLLAATNNILPEQMAAAQMDKMQGPKDGSPKSPSK
ncbi:MAG TPA: SDR family oxidoreductase [Sphingobacterium sp.]|jgi:short-subunit dehydrogenase|nr:SDR family oxidoreductase [Sphingobacterium sp.]